MYEKLANEGSNSTKSEENSPKQAMLSIEKEHKPEEESEAQQVLFGNNKPAKSLIIGDSNTKINDLQKKHFFNFAQQELSLYQSSMA